MRGNRFPKVCNKILNFIKISSNNSIKYTLTMCLIHDHESCCLKFWCKQEEEKMKKKMMRKKSSFFITFTGLLKAFKVKCILNKQALIRLIILTLMKGRRFNFLIRIKSLTLPLSRFAGKFNSLRSGNFGKMAPIRCRLVTFCSLLTA